MDLGSKDSSCPLIVEKSEVLLVKPSKPTPVVSLSLSTIDNDPSFDSIVQAVCVVSPKSYVSSFDLTSLFQQALSDALIYFYPLAGKLHRKSDDNRLELNCKAGDGVPFIRATVACTLSSLNYLDSARDAAYQLVPCYDHVKGFDPLALQVTKFACGGLAIGIAYHHSVCDGDGVAQIFRAIIELAFGKTQPTVIPVWERERLNFKGKIGDVADFPKADSSIATSSCTLTDDDMVREILNITSEDITKLKKTIAEDEQIADEKVTTLEILAALVWRSRCRALNLSPDKTTVLGIAINIRNIIEPPLPEGYYGNTVIGGVVALTARELSGSSLSSIVRLIKDMKRAALEKRYVLGQLSEIERKLEVKGSSENMDGVMRLTDWRQIGVHYDGWGTLVSMIPLIPMTISFLCVLLPPSKAVPEMCGGVRVLVTLPRYAMEKFKEEMNTF